MDRIYGLPIGYLQGVKNTGGLPLRLQALMEREVELGNAEARLKEAEHVLTWPISASEFMYILELISDSEEDEREEVEDWTFRMRKDFESVLDTAVPEDDPVHDQSRKVVDQLMIAYHRLPRTAFAKEAMKLVIDWDEEAWDAIVKVYDYYHFLNDKA